MCGEDAAELPTPDFYPVLIGVPGAMSVPVPRGGSQVEFPHFLPQPLLRRLRYPGGPGVRGTKSDIET